MGRTRKTVFVILSLTLLFVLYNSNIMVSAYRWPRQNADGLYRINATYGEFRQSYSDLSAHFHNGVDIEGTVDTPIYAIEGGIATVSTRGDNLESVIVGRF